MHQGGRGACEIFHKLLALLSALDISRKEFILSFMISKLFSFATVGALALGAVQAADISGKITLKGTPPAEKELPLDPQCGKLHTKKPTTRFFVVGQGGGLADVFVYLKEGASGKTYEVPSKSVLLDQVGCEYTPYVLGLQTNQKLMVRNSDPLLHNVHPTPTAPGNKESNLAQLPKGKDIEHTFPSPEVFLRFKCDVHPWMFAWVGVVDHPFYSVTDKDGSFKISNVPPGSYTVEAYHRKAGKATEKVTIDKDSKELNFTLEVKETP